MNNKQILTLAKIGAAVSVKRMEAQIQRLNDLFPDLRGLMGSAETGTGWAPEEPRQQVNGEATTTAPRRRVHRKKKMAKIAVKATRTMTDKERKAVSVRMRRYWAARRADEKKKVASR